MVGGIYNAVHLLSGAAAVHTGVTLEKFARLYYIVFGSVYALVMFIGFIQGDTILEIFYVNAADKFLHLSLVIAIIEIGATIKPNILLTAK
ncbi:DUF4383 domain-containing protein [Candidatus Saccharibacteria bacterium]|nr:DUF4383 domain-containing protein [Candidatus Saccharibacteria bacterium]